MVFSPICGNHAWQRTTRISRARPYSLVISPSPKPSPSSRLCGSWVQLSGNFLPKWAGLQFGSSFPRMVLPCADSARSFPSRSRDGLPCNGWESPLPGRSPSAAAPPIGRPPPPFPAETAPEPRRPRTALLPPPLPRRRSPLRPHQRQPLRRRHPLRLHRLRHLHPHQRRRLCLRWHQRQPPYQRQRHRFLRSPSPRHPRQHRRLHPHPRRLPRPHPRPHPRQHPHPHPHPRLRPHPRPHRLPRQHPRQRQRRLPLPRQRQRP